MTVHELLQRIAGAYSGATPEALGSFKPVFYSRLKHYEGPELEAAATEVLGSFRPKFDQKFPIPVDFETHLKRKTDKPKEDPPIRRDLDERSTRRSRNIQGWIEGQGRKIKSARPTQVYNACLIMVMEHASRPSWRHLSTDQIRMCEHRAISQERVKRHGPPPKLTEHWWPQIEGIAAEWGIATTLADWASKVKLREAA